MKKKKLSFAYVAKLGYFDFYRHKINGVSGRSYVLDKKLTETEKEYINGFNNTVLGCRRYLQAPEIKYDVIFLGNKCF